MNGKVPDRKSGISRGQRPPVNNRRIGHLLRKIGQAVSAEDPPVVTLIAQTAKDPFRVLISTLLSSRTKDEVTAAASKRLFGAARTPRAMLALSEERIAKLIFPVGFYRTKARAVREACRTLIERFDSQVPDDIDALVELPGVGRKTANLVLIEGFQRPAVCVDTHVHRISNRFGFVETRTPEKTETALRERLPRSLWWSYNELLVSYGKTVCTPLSPKCSICSVATDCRRVGVTRSR